MLVYAFTGAAPFHEEARAAIRQFEAQDTELWISRPIIREYIGTLTRPQSFTTLINIEAVIAQVNAILLNFNVADDNASVTAHLLTLIEETATGGKQVHDANVIATMLAYGIDGLLAHNISDFRRFEDKITLIPLIAESS